MKLQLSDRQITPPPPTSPELNPPPKPIQSTCIDAKTLKEEA